MTITEPTSAPGATSPGFHVMAKPVGPICNLGCRYCFYLEKRELYPPGTAFRMSPRVLERYIRDFIAAQDSAEVGFAWQGGEPTLAGLDFFRRAVALQRRYAAGKRIRNALQTNGTLLDDEWCAFLTEHEFLVGISIDGPRELHDAYRVDRRGRPTFDLVMRGLELLKKHGTAFNTLTVVNRLNSRRPLDIYRFLKQIGSRHIQLIPLVEREPDAEARALGLDLAAPPDPQGGAGTGAPGAAASVTSWSVEPRQYGELLVAIFEEWVVGDIGRVFVQLFDTALRIWSGHGSDLCVFSERCGRALALEHSGDLYSCDHYVYPRWELGNLMTEPLGGLVGSERQRRFGDDKADTLPRYCRECEVRFACQGECPKHRFATTPDGEPGLNYLCSAYRRFFEHVDAYMRAMVQLLAAGRPPAELMALIAEHELSQAWEGVGRNDPCPCGSGRKFKRCCERRRREIESRRRAVESPRSGRA